MFTKVKNEIKRAGIKIRFSDRKIDGYRVLQVKFPNEDKFVRFTEFEDARAIARVESIITQEVSRADVIRAMEQFATTFNEKKQVNVYPPKPRSR